MIPLQNDHNWVIGLNILSNGLKVSRSIRILAVSNDDSSSVPRELILFFEKTEVPIAFACPDGDTPLVYVNGQFCHLTGYHSNEIVGKNCRMLQGYADNIEARRIIKKFFHQADEPSVRTPMINFKQDGTSFINLLYLSRLYCSTGRVVFYFASQFDVTQSHFSTLAAYDATLGNTLTSMGSLASGLGMLSERSLTAIANSAAAIAQVRLTLNAPRLDDPV